MLHHHRAGLFLTARLLLCAAMSVIVATQVTGFAPNDPPLSDDLDGDTIRDRVEPEPDPPGSAPGEVEVRSGENNQLIVTIRGRENNDRFGYSIGIVDDLNLDGHKDLIIGAPRDSDTGRAHIFLGPFLDTGPILITAENADMTLASPDVADDDFGERVAPMSDINNDGVTDLRIRAWFVDGTTTESHTYFFSGSSGAPLFVVTGDDPFDPWAEVPGDADGDGDVDEKDEQAVLDNLGLTGAPGSLAKSQGDLNGDGIVNGLDLALVEGNFATNIFAPFASPAVECAGGQPPPGHHCVADCYGVSRAYLSNTSPKCGNPNGDHDGDGIPNIWDPGSPDYYPFHPCSSPVLDCDNDGIPNWRDPDWDFYFFRDGCTEMIPAPPGTPPAPINNPLSDDWVKCHARSDPDNDYLENWLDHDDDGDGIPDMTDPDPYTPCYITNTCPGPLPPPTGWPPPPPEVSPPQPPQPPGPPPQPPCEAHIRGTFGWWQQMNTWVDWWLPDYLDCRTPNVRLHAVVNRSDCTWTWSAGGVANVVPDPLASSLALAVLNGQPGDGYVTAQCECADTWNFKAVDLSFTIDAPGYPWQQGQPPLSLLWANTDDDDFDDVADHLDLEIPDIGDAELRPITLGGLMGANPEEFQDPVWALSYIHDTLRIWYKPSDGNILDNAYGGAIAPPLTRTIDGVQYNLLPSGVFINGAPPAGRMVYVEGVNPADYSNIYYTFRGNYVHSETEQLTEFSIMRLKVVRVQKVTISLEKPVGWQMDTCPNNGGKRVYPDAVNASAATDEHEREIRVRVSVHPPHEIFSTVHVRLVDVDDPTNTFQIDGTPLGDDNRQEDEPWAQDFDIDVDESGAGFVDVSLSMHPGDNYRVFVSAGSIGSGVDELTQAMADGQDVAPPGVYHSEMITVWRHLWIERDSMMPPGANSLWTHAKIGNFEGPPETPEPHLATQVWKITSIAPELKEFEFPPNGGASKQIDVLMNGRIVIGPFGGPGSHTIHDMPNNEIVWNDLTSIMFPAPPNSMISIVPPGGFEFHAVDGDLDPFGADSTIGGTVSQITKANGTFTFQLNITSQSDTPIPWANFVGGTITVGGGYVMTIVSQNGPASTLTTSNLSIALAVHDDDDEALLPDTNFADLSLVNAVYGAAYLQTLPQGGLAVNNAVEVPFRPHIGAFNFQMAFMHPFQQSAPLERDDCWIAYVVSAFQGELDSDADAPSGDPELGGTDQSGPEGGTVSGIWLEVLNDPESDSLGHEAHTVAHEIGHQFGLDHTPGTIMDVGGQGNTQFSFHDLNMLRNRVRSPGH